MAENPLVDGIAAPKKEPKPQGAQNPSVSQIGPALAAQRRFRLLLVGGVGVPYIVFVLWSIYLLTVLPDVTGRFDPLIPIGTMGSVVIGIFALGIAAFGFLRIQSAQALSLFRRRMAMLRLGIVVVPLLLVCAIVPFSIAREPPLPFVIVSPTSAKDFVAPLSVTFSMQDAVNVLARRNLKPDRFTWDFQGDGKADEDTIEPEATAQYDRAGIYNVAVTIVLKGGGVRRIVRQLQIPKAVFAVDPVQPVVDEPARFSIAQLVAKKEELESVKWDFGDGGEPVLVKDVDAIRTYYVDGPVKVTATITLKNKSQLTYQRTVEVIKSVPLPFEVSFSTQPEHLISPPPFGAMFQVTTDEPVRVILWNFSDGSEEAKGKRVGHTFSKKGFFPVTAEIRAESGKVARITKIVRVVDELQIPDLKFIGSPDVTNGKITGEVPLTVDLKPKTNHPLIDFVWEAPEATTVGSTKGSIEAVYRRKGTYTLTLLGQNADGKALRLPLTVEVLPSSSSVSINMDPEGGVAPLTVRFDASETVIPDEEVSGFEWTFSDEKKSPHQQGAQVSHVFEKPGTYEIQVKVFTTSGKDFSANKTIVVRNPILDACISASRTTGKAPLGVKFSSDCSTFGPDTKIDWDFGDGWRSDEKNPKHDFQFPGEYHVILNLKDGDSVEHSEALIISVNPAASQSSIPSAPSLSSVSSSPSSSSPPAQ